MNILEERKKGKLHTIVEKHLKQLILEVFPSAYTLPEGYGISSGRTDSTIFFVHGGGVAHYELIASDSMVFRDVNNLRTSVADTKLVILMDEKYDPKVANAYYRAVPQNEFPVIWISEIMDSNNEEETKAFLFTQMKQLETIVEESESKVTSTMNSIIPQENRKGLKLEIVLVPREKIDFLGDNSNEDQLWSYFEQFGISSAVSIDASAIGKSWRFWDGDFAAIEGITDDLNLYQSIRISEDGSIRLTLFSEKTNPDDRYLDNLTIALVNQKITQLCIFGKKLFTEKSFSGFTDLIFYISGLEGRKWEVDYTDHFVELYGVKTFTVDTFKSEVYPILVENLSNDQEITKITTEITAKLARRTKKVKKKVQ